MYPEVEEVEVTKDKIQKITMKFDSVLDAAIKGASEASQVVIAIIANLIAFIAFIYFINGVLSWLGMLVGFVDESEMWTLELILGKVLIPVSYIMGVEWDECEKVGQLIGIKTMVNEFVAFQKMGTMTLSVIRSDRSLLRDSECCVAAQEQSHRHLLHLRIHQPRLRRHHVVHHRHLHAQQQVPLDQSGVPVVRDRLFCPVHDRLHSRPAHDLALAIKSFPHLVK
jgi:hypothetical protein